MSVYLDLLDAVNCGKKVNINLVEKTAKINGNDINLDGELINITDMEFLRCNLADQWEILEELYANYKRSVPSATTRTNRPYFKADNVEDLDDIEMAFNMPRDLSQICLEGYVLLAGLSGMLKWKNDKHFFWQSKNFPELVVLRDWI